MARTRATGDARGTSSAASHDSAPAERLGGLIDALLPVLVDRLAETGLGEIEVERDGAIIRVRAEEAAATRGVSPAPAASAPAEGPGSARHDERQIGRAHV